MNDIIFEFEFGKRVSLASCKDFGDTLQQMSDFCRQKFCWDQLNSDSINNSRSDQTQIRFCLKEKKFIGITEELFTKHTNIKTTYKDN
jgi:hypothetical protein